MELYKSRSDFADVLAAASDYLKVSPAIVEKDYFVTLILKELNKNIPGILFKGGTSLSKCFQVVKRFSEDIDLTLDTAHFSQNHKRNANKTVFATCDSLGFQIQNRKQAEEHTHGNYNCFNVMYPTVFAGPGVKPFIKIEMAFIQKSYPDLVKPVSSMIGEYLKVIGQEEAVSRFDLQPFAMKVQSLERTFVDKIFALCDYYLRNEGLRQSRHIYDLSRLMNMIQWRELKELVSEVRKERMNNKTCLSAQPDISVPTVLDEIIRTAYYREDYRTVTMSLLYEKVDYETAIMSVKEIAENDLFK